VIDKVEYVFAALPVRDRDGVLDWYERLFGRAPNFLPNDAEAVWQLAATASVYVLTDGVRAGHGEVTLIVDDLDGQRAALEARDIATEPIVIVPNGGRKSRTVDPDGNAIWFVELTGSG
jgi:predicted enzyme related to lactoylglutathione lyase